jgi:hypothetical protein
MDPKMYIEEPKTSAGRPAGEEKVHENHMTDDLVSPALKIPYDPEEEEEHYNAPAETAEDLVTEVIHATDDPTLNPWTFRTWFLGTSPHPLPSKLTAQESRSRPSAACSRQSTTLNRKPCLCPQSSSPLSATSWGQAWR